jgi:hypothetical protein
MKLDKLGLHSLQVPLSGDTFRDVTDCRQGTIAAAEPGNRRLIIFSPEELIMRVIKILVPKIPKCLGEKLTEPTTNQCGSWKIAI